MLNQTAPKPTPEQQQTLAQGLLANLIAKRIVPNGTTFAQIQEAQTALNATRHM
jgi:hypothetical protein